MKTVLRNASGEITHVHYTANLYLTKGEHQYVTEAEITVPMIEKAYGNPNYVLSLIANGEKSAEMLKLEILHRNGFNYVAHFE